MSKNKLAIKVEDVSKLYRIGMKQRVHDTIGGAALDFIKSPLHNFKKYQSLYNFKDHRRSTDGSTPASVLKALDDVSFSIRKGETVGIIGSNGAGKSTLLKILSRVTSPTEGVIGIRGKIGCLLEVGTGFHMELTGRENIYLNGSILGMRKEEIDTKIDDIIEFSGVEKFIDTPVKRYSSGMKVRVGFAVAAHLDPEILIIDEVLAVGDIRFQEKCIGKMKDVAGEGRTVLFVSHNLSAVQALCTRGILLRNGRIVMDAPVDETINFYLESISDASADPFKENPNRSGSAVVRYTNARILGPDGKEKTHLTAGEPVSFEFAYINKKQISKAFVSMTIYNELGTAVANFDMEIRGYQMNKLEEKGTVLCHIESLPLPIGRYRVAIAMIHKGIGMADHVPNALTFTVANSKFFETGRTPQVKFSACMVHHHWEHTKQDDPVDESGGIDERIAVPSLEKQQN